MAVCFSRNCELVEGMVTCWLHKETVTLWCRQCLNLCCHVCPTSLIHDGHTLVDVADSMEELERAFAEERDFNLAALIREINEKTKQQIHHAKLLTDASVFVEHFRDFAQLVDENVKTVADDRHKVEEFLQELRDDSVNRRSQDAEDKVHIMFTQCNRFDEIINKVSPVNLRLDPVMKKILDYYSVTYFFKCN